VAASTAPAGTAVFTVAWRSASHVAPHRETGHTTRRGDAFLVPLADIQQCQSLQVHQVASADFDVRWSAPMTAPVPASFIALPPLPQRCSSVVTFINTHLVTRLLHIARYSQAIA